VPNLVQIGPLVRPVRDMKESKKKQEGWLPPTKRASAAKIN